MCKITDFSQYYIGFINLFIRMSEKRHCFPTLYKRPSFVFRKAVNRRLKDGLLHCERWSFRMSMIFRRIVDA